MGSIRGRGSYEEIFLRSYLSLSSDWLILSPLSDAKLKFGKKRSKKKTQNRNIKFHEKLVCIQKYYDHENEYKPYNKEKFLSIIGELLKQKTGYKIVHLIHIVTWWVKVRIDELVEEEIGLGTKVE